MSRFRVKRTPNTGPPAGLLFGEMAYSDGDQQLYVGRVDTAAPPAIFESESTDYSGAIAALALDVDALETSQAGQDSAIAALTSDVAALESAPPPVTGWDYIGPTEPIAPAVGFTWWEKVVGATVGQWEWSGSVWTSIQRFKDRSATTLTLSSNTGSAPSSHLAISPIGAASGILVDRFAVTFWASNLEITLQNDWLFSASIRGWNAASGAGGNISLFSEARLSIQTVGTPGNFLQYFFIQDLAILSSLPLVQGGQGAGLIQFTATKLNNAPTLSGCLLHVFWRYTK